MSACSARAGSKRIALASFTALFDQLGHQAGPPSLMTCAEAGAVVAMKVLVEQNQISPVRIVLEYFGSTVDGPAAVVATQERTDHTARKFGGPLPQIAVFPGASRAFNLEILAIVMMKLLQRLDQEIVHGKPDGPAPVRISAEHRVGRFRGFVLHATGMAVDGHLVGMIEVVARQCADAIGGQKLSLVEHPQQHALQLLAADQ